MTTTPEERREAPKLNMTQFLRAVEQHGTQVREALIEQGHQPNVIFRKAQRAASKGYTDYGSIADRCWLTDAGRDFLADQQ